jgi:replicative DNA helicase
VSNTEDKRLVPPASPEAEAVVVGALLSDLYQDRTLAYLDDITPSDFSVPTYKQIFQAILSMMAEGITPDEVLVNIQLPNVKTSELVDLQSRGCIPNSLPHYISILHEHRRGRKLCATITTVAQEFSQGAEYEKLENYLLSALNDDIAGSDTSSVCEGIDTEQMLTGDGEQGGVCTGITEIDRALCGGIRPGEVCLLAARTSVGKSALAVEIALNAVELGWETLYMSYEMPKNQLWKRLLAYQSGVSLRKFRNGLFTGFEQGKIRNAKETIMEYMPKFRVNTCANTPDKLSRLVRVEQVRGAAQFLVIDHAGRMQMDDRANASGYERMSAIINRTKDLAIQLNIPVLMLWQLSRSVERKEDKRPGMEDLRDSGQAEEIADMIMFLSRDNYYDTTIPWDEAEVVINIAKARDGAYIGDLKIPWKRILCRPEDEEPRMQVGQQSWQDEGK